MAIAEARLILERAIRDRTFPGATVDVGDSRRSLWSEALGALRFDPESTRTTIDTPYDLASLTKVVATTSVIMQMHADGDLRLEEPIARSVPEWRGADREHVTVRDLLEHASGLPARLVDAPPAGRREFEHEICATTLEYEPRSRSIYSDLGFILLGFIAADRGGASLAKQFDALMARLKPDLAFELTPELRRLAAPTLPMDDDPRRGRMLVGEVHDHYAAALGGVAGHAGLFGAAPAVGTFARAVLRAARGATDVPVPFSPTMVARFTRKSAVAGSSRALGWDTMLPTSSCGTHMSPAAFGHVGFTGTSLWIDPTRDRYYVLLTNRVCGGGSLDDMRTVRRAFHDGLADV